MGEGEEGGRVHLAGSYQVPPSVATRGRGVGGGGEREGDREGGGGEGCRPEKWLPFFTSSSQQLRFNRTREGPMRLPQGSDAAASFVAGSRASPFVWWGEGVGGERGGRREEEGESLNGDFLLAWFSLFFSFFFCLWSPLSVLFILGFPFLSLSVSLFPSLCTCLCRCVYLPLSLFSFLILPLSLVLLPLPPFLPFPDLFFLLSILPPIVSFSPVFIFFAGCNLHTSLHLHG